MNEPLELLCGYDGNLKDRALEIAKNILTIEETLVASRDEVKGQPLAVVEVVGDAHPHEVLRENKILVSFRNLVKTHADLVLKLSEIIGKDIATEVDSIGSLAGEISAIAEAWKPGADVHDGSSA